ncbi:GlxA family transcriptional regulator [Pseudomonas akapageensis]|uniref:GlxA family transcriptional regulator n=1 Tax=Pseudomonas akapageensis TaxID=2609961 RepID=UPI00140AC6CC|nr:helix-turn-helix domain-containing protein [Pseudomonas akapageensis]
MATPLLHTFDSSRVYTQAQQQSIGFLLEDNFSLMALASAIEPLRLANQLSGHELYRWHTLTQDGRPVCANNGLQVSPNAAASLAPTMDALFVCDGEGVAVEHQRNEPGARQLPFKHMLGQVHPKLQEVVELMENNVREPLSLDELANYLSVSRRQLERLFLKYLHCTPSRYYLKLRLIRARQLLRYCASPVMQVAAECGFISTQHFTRRYREQYGVSPKRDRLQGVGAKLQTVP